MAKQLSSKNFTRTEILLTIIAALGAIFTGYYIYNANQNISETYAAADKVAQADPIKTDPKKSPATAVNDETADWLLYTSPGNEFSLKLADGWTLERYQKSPFIYTFSNTTLAPKPGQRAIVKQIEGGKDGSGEGLSLGFSTEDREPDQTGQKVRTFKTAAGDTVTVYSRIETEDQFALGQLEKGGTYYDYYVTKSAAKHFHVSYGFNVGQTDYHQLIETAIKTLVIQ